MAECYTFISACSDNTGNTNIIGYAPPSRRVAVKGKEWPVRL